MKKSFIVLKLKKYLDKCWHGGVISAKNGTRGTNINRGGGPTVVTFFQKHETFKYEAKINASYG